MNIAFSKSKILKIPQIKGSKVKTGKVKGEGIVYGDSIKHKCGYCIYGGFSGAQINCGDRETLMSI